MLQSEAVPRAPRLLLAGGAPVRLAPCAVLWRGWWWETVSPRVTGLVEVAAQFDVVFCEPENALRLLADSARTGVRPPAIIVLAVDGLDGARAFAASLPLHVAETAFAALMGSPRVVWLAASDEQEATIHDAGVPAERLSRIDAFAFVYHTMLVDALERLRPDATIDAHLAPEILPDAVVVPGTGRRDPATWLSAAALLPDVPFVSIGMSDTEVADALEALGLPRLPNVSVIPFLPLEAFIAALRRSRLCVVCLEPGRGDGGHTTTCLAHVLGVSVIASGIPGVANYVEDGRSARVVPPRDPRALATAVRWLWEDGRARDALRAGGRVAEVERRERSEAALFALLDRLVTAPRA